MLNFEDFLFDMNCLKKNIDLQCFPLYCVNKCTKFVLSICTYTIYTYRKLTRVGLKLTTTEFRSDGLFDWAIRPWIQLALRATLYSYSNFIICSVLSLYNIYNTYIWYIIYIYYTLYIYYILYTYYIIHFVYITCICIIFIFLCVVLCTCVGVWVCVTFWS